MATVNELLRQDIHFSDDFERNSSGNDLDSVSGRENLRLSLLRRLATSPGAIVHRPEYGVGIKSYLNGSMTLDTRRRIATDIADQFPLDPRVTNVVSVAVNQDFEEPSLFKIRVRLTTIGTGSQDFEFLIYGD